MGVFPRNVKDRVVLNPTRYRLVPVTADTFDLVPVPGTVTEAGTEINKAYLQPIEDAMVDYTLLVPYGGTTTGVANTYVIATPVIAALAVGMAISAKINVDSTAASTLNWGGQGAKPIKKAHGAAVSNLKSGGIYTFRYDGTNFILQGEGGSGDALASDLLLGKKASTDADDIVGTMVNNGAVTLPFSYTDTSIVAGYHNGSGKALAPTFSAGEIVQISVPGNGAYTTSYQKINSATCKRKGVVRVSIRPYKDSDPGMIYARIYVNDIARGIERTSLYDAANSATYTEDITVNAGDVISIYGKAPSGNIVYSGNLIIKASTTLDIY